MVTLTAIKTMVEIASLIAVLLRRDLRKKAERLVGRCLVNESQQLVIAKVLVYEFNSEFKSELTVFPKIGKKERGGTGVPSAIFRLLSDHCTRY